MSAIERVVHYAGGQAAVARKLGIRQQSVYMWVKKKTVPAERVLELERISDYTVSRNELRPDIYPADICF